MLASTAFQVMVGDFLKYLVNNAPRPAGAADTKPVLYFHIGLPKTGSTSIQCFLLDNREHLLRQGVLYPWTGLHGPGHMELASAFTGRPLRDMKRGWNLLGKPKGKENLRNSILREADTATPDVHSIVISSEALADVEEGAIEELVSLYEPYLEIKVICFLRRQDFLAESVHSQAYRVRDLQFKREHALKGSIPLLNQRRLLDKWALHTGVEGLSLFEYPENANDFRIIETAKQALGLQDLSLPEEPQWMNQRLSRDALEYIWTHTNLKYGTKPYFTAVDALQKYSALHPTPARYACFYSPPERQHILDHFNEMNKELSEQHFQGELFSSCPDIRMDEHWQEYPGLKPVHVREIDDFLAAQGLATRTLRR